MTKRTRQTVYFDAPPRKVFETLMDAKKHAAFTGDKAKVSDASAEPSPFGAATRAGRRYAWTGTR